MIKTEKLVYGSANSSVQFEGSISYDDSFDTPRPGVLVCHAYGCLLYTSDAADE